MCTEAWHGLEAIFKSPKPLVLPHCQHHFLECFHHLNLGNHGWQTWQHAKDGKRPCFPNPVKSSLDGLGEAEPYKSHFTAWHKLGNFLTFCSGNDQMLFFLATQPFLLQYLNMLHPSTKGCQLSELLKAYRNVYVDVRVTVYVTYSNDSNFHTPSLFPPFEPESSLFVTWHLL